MHVNARKIAFSGIMLALSVICIVLSGVLKFNTLFLLGIAAFSVGIVIREFGQKYGAAYLIAAVFLGFMLAPNKLYCITFAAMGIYVFADELLWPVIQKLSVKIRINVSVSMWIGKFVIFNVMYIPMLFAFPKLLFAGDISREMIWIALFAGQFILVIYDKAYDYFQKYIWSKYRKILDVH